MARYFFHVFNDLITLDEEGTECADLEAAREWAVENARILVCESVRHGHVNLEHRLEIADESGARQMTVTFREAFIIKG